MTIREVTIEKMQRLPEPLIQEVGDFVEFLLIRQNRAYWQMWTHFKEGLMLSESDLPDYLSNLVNYEESLARGDIQW